MDISFLVGFQRVPFMLFAHFIDYKLHLMYGADVAELAQGVGK